jgi:hypothetical protein
VKPHGGRKAASSIVPWYWDGVECSGNLTPTLSLRKEREHRDRFAITKSHVMCIATIVCTVPEGNFNSLSFLKERVGVRFISGFIYSYFG